MYMTLRRIVAVAIAAMLGIAAATCLAADGADQAPLVTGETPAWSFEVTPYAWLPGLKGDITLNNYQASIDQSFSDIFKAVKFAGAVLALARYERWIVWTQVDFQSLSTSKLDNAPPRARLDAKQTFYTLAGGYTFDGWTDRQTFDVLIGIQGFNADNTLSLNTIGNFSKSRNIVDATVIVRPSFRISQRWLFNPTVSVGGGDSKYFYQLQPQFQYEFSKTWEARFGYRKMHYTIDASRGTRYDMNLSGPLFGFGATF
jgi:hypothetical protein